LYASISSLSSYVTFPDYNLDFNSITRDGTYHGAYHGITTNPGWALALGRKGQVTIQPTTSNTQSSITGNTLQPSTSNTLQPSTSNSGTNTSNNSSQPQVSTESSMSIRLLNIMNLVFGIFFILIL